MTTVTASKDAYFLPESQQVLFLERKKKEYSLLLNPGSLCESEAPSVLHLGTKITAADLFTNTLFSLVYHSV